MADLTGQKVSDLERESPLFYLFESSDLEAIWPYLKEKVYSSGTTLFNEGDPGDFLAIIRSGRVEVKKQTEFEGSWIVLAQLGKGSILGESSMLDNHPRSASVQVLEDSAMILLYRDALESFCQDYPLLGIKLLRGIARILSLRLRQLDYRLTQIF